MEKTEIIAAIENEITVLSTNYTKVKAQLLSLRKEIANKKRAKALFSGERTIYKKKKSKIQE